MSDFMLSIMRMTDEHLLEYLVAEAEQRAIYIYQTDPITEIEWETVDRHTDKIESIKAELLRRM